jgi:hypothetical protein
MEAGDVRERLDFARRRLAQLLALNGGDLAGADVHERQQLIQEFFFHLIGAIEVLAQLVNEVRVLGLDDEGVSVSAVAAQLRGDPLEPLLRQLYANSRRRPVPANPYSDDALLFRAYNYRHQVTHRRRNPFNFHVRLGDAALSTAAPPPPFSRTAHLLIDPRDPGRGPSTATLADELERMLDLVTSRCEAVLAAL